MKINVETDQQFLALAYALQGNYSNAVSTPKHLIRRILDRRVYYARDDVKGAYIFGLVPLQAVEAVEVDLKVPVMRSKGRKAISGEKIAEIWQMRLEGHSVRSIASELKVGRGTVEKYMNLN